MFSTPPGQKMHLPWGQGAGEVMTATTATPDRVRTGFRRRMSFTVPRSRGSTRARVSEFGGTLASPCRRHSSILARLEGVLVPDLAVQHQAYEVLVVAQRCTLDLPVVDPVVVLLLLLFLGG